MGGTYEVAVQMGLGTMIYIPSFIKFGSVIQNVMRGGGYTQTQRYTENIVVA
jgi:hypothetical protein